MIKPQTGLTVWGLCDKIKATLDRSLGLEFSPVSVARCPGILLSTCYYTLVYHVPRISQAILTPNLPPVLQAGLLEFPPRGQGASCSAYFRLFPPAFPHVSKGKASDLLCPFLTLHFCALFAPLCSFFRLFSPFTCGSCTFPCITYCKGSYTPVELCVMRGSLRTSDDIRSKLALFLQVYIASRTTQFVVWHCATHALTAALSRSVESIRK